MIAGYKVVFYIPTINIADGFGYRKSKAVAIQSGCWRKPLEQSAAVGQFPLSDRLLTGSLRSVKEIATCTELLVYEPPDCLQDSQKEFCSQQFYILILGV